MSQLLNAVNSSSRVIRYAGLPAGLLRSIFFCVVVLLSLQATPICSAMPLGDYHIRLQRALLALTTLAQTDESDTGQAREARIRETTGAVRGALPQTETIELNHAVINADNSWLHTELDKYEQATPGNRADLLARMTERLQALEQRAGELEKANTAAGDKVAARQKLAEIMQRPEYVQGQKPPSALSRVWNELVKWLKDLLPKPKPLEPGSANLLTLLAQIFVILLGVGVLAYVAKMFAPRLFGRRSAKKKVKDRPRIVLGERLEPDQSALDLLNGAEALARRGELRAAIRQAYIALLVELGDRKIISLEQHKTNRDYLRSLRALEPLHSDVKLLTDSFERHWYGFVLATDADWNSFRDGYKQALRR
ncbi:MAG: DUF4129 domain-containing protein [bacterium]